MFFDNRSVHERVHPICISSMQVVPMVLPIIGSEVEKLVLGSQASSTASPLEFEQVVLPFESARTPAATHKRAMGLLVS